jgi:membrane protein
MIAQALAYSTFFAIPSVLLLAVGLFTLIVGPQTITTVVDHLGRVMPQQATTLVSDSLHRLNAHHGTSLTMVLVGGVLALWSTTGAMTTYMTALNVAYGRRDRRNLVVKRLTALLMVACIGIAFLLVAVFLIFGPQIERHVRGTIGIGTELNWIWWAAQWPILVAALLAAFATLLYLGPDVDHRRWRFLTPGSAIAVVAWLAASAGFAYYASNFGSYNKAWGSFAAVIVMLTWLWIAGLALLFGAEVNAELERQREPRPGEPAEPRLEVPARSGAR